MVMVVQGLVSISVDGEKHERDAQLQAVFAEEQEEAGSQYGRKRRQGRQGRQ